MGEDGYTGQILTEEEIKQLFNNSTNDNKFEVEINGKTFNSFGELVDLEKS